MPLTVTPAERAVEHDVVGPSVWARAASSGNSWSRGTGGREAVTASPGARSAGPGSTPRPVTAACPVSLSTARLCAGRSGSMHAPAREQPDLVARDTSIRDGWRRWLHPPGVFGLDDA